MIEKCFGSGRNKLFVVVHKLEDSRANLLKEVHVEIICFIIDKIYRKFQTDGRYFPGNEFRVRRHPNELESHQTFLGFRFFDHFFFFDKKIE